MASSQPTAGLYGPRLPGTRKWLGGAFDASGTAILGVPSHSGKVLKLDTATGEVTYLPGPNLPGKFKWLRGIRTPDGAVFCIPACADCVLRIGAGGELDLLGKGVVPEPRGLGNWLYHGAGIGSDGNIYAVPSNAERVLKIDPVTWEVIHTGFICDLL